MICEVATGYAAPPPPGSPPTFAGEFLTKIAPASGVTYATRLSVCLSVALRESHVSFLTDFSL